MPTTSRHSSKTLLTLWESHVGSSPIEYVHIVHKQLPLRVHVCIGGWWPDKKPSENFDGLFEWDYRKPQIGFVYVPWEQATMPVIVHEAVHVGWWAARYARDNQLLRQLVPKGPYTRTIAQAQEEFCAMAVDQFIHVAGVRLADRGVIVPPFEWHAVGGRPDKERT